MTNITTVKTATILITASGKVTEHRMLMRDIGDNCLEIRQEKIISILTKLGIRPGTSYEINLKAD
jgi:hypothetical protein